MMVAKIAIHVCPTPGCVTIASKVRPCPKHPHHSLVRAIYEHRSKPVHTKPEDLKSATKKSSNFDSMGDILHRLFGSEQSRGKS